MLPLEYNSENVRTLNESLERLTEKPLTLGSPEQGSGFVIATKVISRFLPEEGSA
jgi:hypothetical protein